MTAQRRTGRVVVPAVAAVAIFAAIAAAVLAGRGDPSPPRSVNDRSAPRTAPPRHVIVRRVPSLPAPVQDPATAALRGAAVASGGLDSADVSTDSIVRLGSHGTRRAGALPQPLHDAAAAVAGRGIYVFGGGEPSLDSIIRVSPGRPKRVGTLPAAASDVGAAAVMGRAYVVGGYTGTRSLDTIVSWRPGARARVVAHLPVALRYPAVTSTADRKLVVAGGTAGLQAVRSIYLFDPRTARVRRIGRLPHALTHAAAAAVGSTVYVAGGRGAVQGSQLATVFAVDARTGRVTRAGRLPRPSSDMGAAVVGGRVLLTGGRDRAGRVLDDVLELTPTP